MGLKGAQIHRIISLKHTHFGRGWWRRLDAVGELTPLPITNLSSTSSPDFFAPSGSVGNGVCHQIYQNRTKDGGATPEPDQPTDTQREGV